MAVPSPLSTKVTPAGSAPVRSIGWGWRTPAGGDGEGASRPTVNVVWSPLVIAGRSVTVRVKDWVASGPPPLVAVIVIG